MASIHLFREGFAAPLAHSDRGITELVQNNSSFPTHGVLQKTKKSFFRTKLGCVSFEKHLGSHVISADPIVYDMVSRTELVNQFVNWSHSQNKSVCGYYFSEDLALSLKSKFFVHKAGVSQIMNLEKFSLVGKKSMEIRRALRKGQQCGLKYKELCEEDKGRWFQKIKDIEIKRRRWRQTPQISFLLSEPQLHYETSHRERWFIAYRGEEIHAFISLVPFGGGQGKKVGYYVDDLVQSIGGERFALDALISSTISQVYGEGAQEISFGLSAFMGFKAATGYEAFFRVLSYVSWPYNARGIYFYKRKFTNTQLQRYIFVDRKSSFLGQFLALFKATYPQFFSFYPKPWNWRVFSQELRYTQSD